jgi:hypothetical protein
MVESEGLKEVRDEEYKSRCICECKPLVGKHTAISVERPLSVAIGYYPIEGEGANLDWYLVPGTRNAPLSISGPCGPIFQPGHSVPSARSVRTSLFLMLTRASAPEPRP